MMSFWRRFAKNKLAVFGLFVVGTVLGISSFLLALHQTQHDNSYAYFGTFERAWQLALGGMTTFGGGSAKSADSPLVSTETSFQVPCNSAGALAGSLIGTNNAAAASQAMLACIQVSSGVS